ncbi:hypothetical protein Hanom_Chr00s000001g01592491 [Helianthus anomalus]
MNSKIRSHQMKNITSIFFIENEGERAYHFGERLTAEKRNTMKPCLPMKTT